MSRWRKWYGAGPVHLLALLACFALTAYVAAQVVEVGPWKAIALWLVGAAVAHDFVLYPLYALADLPLRGRVRPGSLPAISWRNHLRFPLALSALLLLLWFPLILGLPETTFSAAAGASTAPYLPRWLLITGGLFAGSAVVYAYRLRRARRGAHQAPVEDECRRGAP
ncbi:MAG: hypothetical protein ACRDRV_07815 [Pseudonocardiaceae bacterium]